MLTATTTSTRVETPIDSVTLGFDDRYRRRFKVTTDNGQELLIDLPHATALRSGMGLVLGDQRQIEIIAAPEALMRVTAPSASELVRVAWHVGNRHLACEASDQALVLREDHVIAEMLEGLGAKVERFTGPFEPEGGAYAAGHSH